jgi:hypothetical protein
MRKPAVLFLIVALLVAVMATPSSEPAEAQVGAVAGSAGFGAAFAYAQTIGPVAITSAGSIGNGGAAAFAITPWSWSWSGVLTGGPAGAMAQAIGTPWGSTAATQVMSMPGGFALGAAYAN